MTSERIFRPILLEQTPHAFTIQGKVCSSQSQDAWGQENGTGPMPKASSSLSVFRVPGPTRLITLPADWLPYHFAALPILTHRVIPAGDHLGIKQRNINKPALEFFIPSFHVTGKSHPFCGTGTNPGHARHQFLYSDGLRKTDGYRTR